MQRALTPTCVLLALVACVLSGCGDGKGSSSSGTGPAQAARLGPVPDRAKPSGRPRVAFVTNGPASFWDIAAVGARKAGQDFDCEVDVRIPSPATAEKQQSDIQDLIARDVDGIAISPIDGENQTQLVNEACKGRYTITHDSDAPHSDRICYVGMDNYEAGRMCGKLVKEALPDGGKVMIFVGRLSQANAKGRRQGVIDELLGRSQDPARYDEPGSVPRSGKWIILGTRTDGFDNSAAKANAEDTLARHPDIAGMVGLFAYNPPQILEALKGAGKLGAIQVIGFDEADETLQAIKDGHVHGTVVQDPFLYGYESIRVLAALSRGDRSVLPEDGFKDIPARQIRKDNVDAFWKELKVRLAGGR